MSIPENITKEDLIKAIEKINHEGFPKDADSQYYDVVHEGKTYPPKVVVSYANIFANGEELDRKSFEGGLGTPCFKLLEQNGFLIEKKNNPIEMSRIQIYEIKTSSAENAKKLLSPDGNYFYWNNTLFSGNSVDDRVFFINRSGDWALFTTLTRLDILAKFNDQDEISSFNHEYNTFSVEDPDGRYSSFIRFDIKQKVTIPTDWNWQTQLGSSEIFDLWKEGIDVSPGRFEKIDDLKILFSEGPAYETLEEADKLLRRSDRLNKDIIDAIKSKKIQDLINTQEFYHDAAQEKYLEFKSFTEPSAGFFSSLLTAFEAHKNTFTSFQNTFQTDSNEFGFLTLVAELVAYCDTHAAKKVLLNKYDDKRVLASSGVYQNDWLINLLRYKIAGNNSLNVAPSVKNALDFLENPLNGITMLSSNHREMVTKSILKQSEYNPNQFVDQIISFFEPYQIDPINPKNLGVIISFLLYHFPKIKELWLEKVSGLVVCDNTGWIEASIEELKVNKKIIVWWDKSPTKGAKVLKLLKETLDNSESHSFHIYFSVHQKAKYRANVIDFATSEDYSGKGWNKSKDIGYYQDNFSEYKEI